MTPAEIITADAQQRGIDPQKVLGAIQKVLENKSGRILYTKNTVLFVRMISDQNGELHLFTEDSPIVIARAVPKFWDALKSMGVRRVYGEADNQEIIQLLQRLGANVQTSDIEGYNWMAEV